MSTVCPYCNIEVSESAIEAEDGCCPECGAEIGAPSTLMDEGDFDDGDLEEQDVFSDLDDEFDDDIDDDGEYREYEGDFDYEFNLGEDFDEDEFSDEEFSPEEDDFDDDDFEDEDQEKAPAPPSRAAKKKSGRAAK